MICAVYYGCAVLVDRFINFITTPLYVITPHISIKGILAQANILVVVEILRVYPFFGGETEMRVGNDRNWKTG